MQIILERSTNRIMDEIYQEALIPLIIAGRFYLDFKCEDTLLLYLMYSW